MVGGARRRFSAVGVAAYRGAVEVLFLHSITTIHSAIATPSGVMPSGLKMRLMVSIDDSLWECDEGLPLNGCECTISMPSMVWLWIKSVLLPK